MRRVGPMHNPAGGHVITRNEVFIGEAGDLNLKKQQYLPNCLLNIPFFFFARREEFFVFALFNRIFVVSNCSVILSILYTNISV